MQKSLFQGSQATNKPNKNDIVMRKKDINREPIKKKKDKIFQSLFPLKIIDEVKLFV